MGLNNGKLACDEQRQQQRGKPGRHPPLQRAASSLSGEEEEKVLASLKHDVRQVFEQIQDDDPMLDSTGLQLYGLNQAANSLTSRQCKLLGLHLRYNTHLKDLRLSGNKKLSGAGLQLLCDGIKENKHLQHLNVYDCALIAADMEKLAQAVRGHPSLKIIDVGKNSIGDQGLASLLAVSGCLELGAHKTGISAHGLNALLKTCGNWTHLGVGEDHFGDAALARLCTMLHQNQACRTLLLMFSSITDQGMEQLCNVLKTFPDFDCLNVNCNIRLTNASAVPLGRLKARFPKIEICCDKVADRFIEAAAVAARDRDVLIKFGAVPVTRARLILCGHQFTGKTTLAARLCSAKSNIKRPEKSRTRTLSTEEIKPMPEQRTAGVDVKLVQLVGGGDFVLYDLAGQTQYVTPHSLIAREQAVIALVLSLGDSSDARREQLELWLRFLKARFVPVSSGSGRVLPKVHLVLTHRDLKDLDESDVVFQNGKWESPWGDGAVKVYGAQFADKIDIDPHVYIVDNFGAQHDAEMDLLRAALRASREQLLKHASQAPALVQELLPELKSLRNRYKGWPIQKVADFWRLMCEANKKLRDDVETLPPVEKSEVVHAMFRFLQGEGEIIWLEHADVVVLDPEFLCSHVIGRLFAPKWFPFHTDQVAGGQVTKQALAAAFPRQDVDHVVTLIRELDLGFEVSEDTFLLPALLQTTEPACHGWQVVAGDTVLGRRLQCEAESDYFGPSFFPRLQVRLHAVFGAALTLWRDGADGVRAGVRCRIAMGSNGQTLDVWAHGSADTGMAVLMLLEDVVEQAREVMLADCVNIDTVYLALSPTALRREHAGADPHLVPGYCVQDLEACSDEEATPTHPSGAGPVERVDNLLGRPRRIFADMWPFSALGVGSGQLRVLVVRSNSRIYKNEALDTDREEKAVQKAARHSQHANFIELRSIGDPQPRDLAAELAEFRPHCVHIAGHHDDRFGFEFRTDQGVVEYLSATELCTMVQAVEPQLHLACVLVNCCGTVAFAKALLPVTCAAIGTGGISYDKQALAFAQTFWRTLLDGENINAAFDQANGAIERQIEQLKLQPGINFSIPNPQYQLLMTHEYAAAAAAADTLCEKSC